MATIKDVAEAAHVSFKTVSRVLNNEPNVRDEVRLRVIRAVEDLDYRPNLAAKMLRTQKSQVIGLITDRIATTPYASNIVKGAQDAAWRAGKMLIMINTDGETSIEDAAVETLIERQVEGIIFAAVHHQLVIPPQALQSVPSVLVNCYSKKRRWPSIVPDELLGGFTATHLLLAKKHKRVAFINGRSDFPAAKGRLAGYKKALAKNKIAFDEKLVLQGGWWQQDGYENTLKLMAIKQPPTAIFCASDRIAMGAYDALRELGLKVPDDVAIVGFDNHEIIAAHLRPSLTTVELPYYKMGKWGIDYLLAHQGEQGLVQLQEKIECPLIIRHSA